MLQFTAMSCQQSAKTVMVKMLNCDKNEVIIETNSGDELHRYKCGNVKFEGSIFKIFAVSDNNQL